MADNPAWASLTSKDAKEITFSTIANRYEGYTQVFENAKFLGDLTILFFYIQ